MVVRINELSGKTERPPPPAFQGKSIEDVVVGLIGQVNQLTVKLKDARDRIRELETDVTKLSSLTQGLPQMVNQQGAKLDQHDAMLSDHDWSLTKLNAVFDLELFSGTWTGTLDPERLKLKIKAKEIKVESLSTLKTKSAHGTEIDSGGSLSLDSSGATAMSGNTVTVSSGWLNVKSPMVDATGLVKCKTLVAGNVVATTYSPGQGNIW